MNRHNPRAQKGPPGPASPGGEIRDPRAHQIVPLWATSGQAPPSSDVSLSLLDGSSGPPGEQLSDEAAVAVCLDKNRLARFLGISVRTLDRANAMGLLPCPDLTVGRSPRWSPQTIQRWLKTRPRLPGRKGADHVE